jgi:hypothetical protein
MPGKIAERGYVFDLRIIGLLDRNFVILEARTPYIDLWQVLDQRDREACVARIMLFKQNIRAKRRDVFARGKVDDLRLPIHMFEPKPTLVTHAFLEFAG